MPIKTLPVQSSTLTRLFKEENNSFGLNQQRKQFLRKCDVTSHFTDKMRMVYLYRTAEKTVKDMLLYKKSFWLKHRPLVLHNYEKNGTEDPGDLFFQLASYCAE